jgi:hypothetical protein
LLRDAEAMEQLHDRAWHTHMAAGDGFAGAKKWYAQQYSSAMEATAPEPAKDSARGAPHEMIIE